MRKLIFIPLILFSLVASGTNYYVKNGGNDGAAGTSDATAWATIAKIYSYRNSFAPGDTIFFKAGNTFTQSDSGTEIIYITQSGTSGNPITYTSYGAGAKPIFTGIGEITGWDTEGNWTEVSNNIWRMAWSRYSYKNRIWIGGNEQVRCETATVTSTETVYSNGTYLYVYSTSNPATVFPSMVSHTSDRTFIVSYDMSYINITNLDIRGYNDCIRLQGCDYININDCNIGYDCGKYGIIITGSSSSNYINIYNNTFDTNDKINTHLFESHNTEDGVLIKDNSFNINVYDNEFYDWGHTALYIYCSGTTYPIQNVKVYDNYFSSVNIDYGRALGGDISLVTQSSGIEIFRNYITDQACHSQIQLPGAKIHYNIFDNTRKIPWRIPYSPDGHGLMISGYYSPTDGMEILNNVFSNNDGVGIFIHNSSEYKDITGMTIANNIFYNNGGNINDQWYNILGYTGYQLFIEDWTTVGSNTYKNNLFYKAGVTDLIYYGGDAADDYPHTVTEFNAENGNGGDVISNNIGGNPLFTGGSPYSFVLQGESPCIDAGINVSLTTDYAGNTVPINLIPDIGAYEYGEEAPPEPPAGTGFARDKTGKFMKDKNDKLMMIIQ